MNQQTKVYGVQCNQTGEIKAVLSTRETAQRLADRVNNAPEAVAQCSVVEFIVDLALPLTQGCDLYSVSPYLPGKETVKRVSISDFGYLGRPTYKNVVVAAKSKSEAVDKGAEAIQEDLHNRITKLKERYNNNDEQNAVDDVEQSPLS